MELEISIEDLLNKHRVESDRIEFKAGWNPDEIYHSVCAFANDFDNVGGGYIIIGVEEKNGIAVRPVKGLEEQERELVNMTNYAPFDTRPNFEATEEDISVTLLRDHLVETKSKLSKQVIERGAMAILNDMQLLVGPPEQQYISNVALMMFCEHLDKFFPYTQVEMVRFPEGSIKNPNNFKEFPIIKGSVPTMTGVQ